MQKTKLLGLSLVSLVLTLLAGCSVYTPNTQQARAENYVNKPMRLPSDMMVAETKHWKDSNRYWVFSPPAKPYYNNYINDTLPTLAELQKQPDTYRIWRGSATLGWSRIVGVIEKGTRFHITDVVSKNSGKGFWMMADIDEGQYKDRNVIFAEPGNVIPAKN